MKKFLLTFFILTIISPCVMAETFMAKALDSWVGYTVDDVIAVWGYPKSEKKIAGKNLVYWTNNQYVVSGNKYGVYGGETFCNKIFEVDKRNKIISWQYEGNSCPNFYFTGSFLVNPNNDVWKIKKQIRKEVKAERKRLKKEAKGKKE